MNTAVLRSWAAWSPGREDEAAWRAWAAHPEALEHEGRPEVAFLPALLRRRCSTLTRIMLAAGFGCCEAADRAEVRTVFASRHGNINESISLFERLSKRQPLSPARFSHTVHNAQAGLYSIAAENRLPSSSIAAQDDTFACGFVEALAHLQREPERAVLLVMADIPLDATAAYGMGLLLANDGDGQAIAFSSSASNAPAEPKAWPDAIEFLRWLITDEPQLQLGSGRVRWSWNRVENRGAQRAASAPPRTA
ncbi:MAG: beta-ketoacyl synthase chain length factor [Deltaproteobacteria bacterium]|nr:beta-ketoacyl synthase chain length factor [Deltaproteobacteria bacterium]